MADVDPIPHFRIKGLPPYDGDYPIDFTEFTNRELHTIKRISGVRAGEIQESFEAGDSDLLVAFIIIALQRSGQNVPKEGENVIWDAPLGAVQLVLPDVEDAEDPTPPTKNESAPESSRSESENNSGETSVGPGDHLELYQSVTGNRG